MKTVKLSQKTLNEAVNVLEKGGIVVCPTDTVYGFLADAGNKKAVEKIFEIKQRPKSKPLPVFVKDIKIAEELAEISAEQKKILKKYWPGKYTFILKSKVSCDIGSRTKLYGVDADTIALRVPKYKFLNDLLKKINKPLAQTSANISGEPVLTKINDIISQFGRTSLSILIIDVGNLPKSNPSKIIDLTGEHLTRLR